MRYRKRTTFECERVDLELAKSNEKAHQRHLPHPTNAPRTPAVYAGALRCNVLVEACLTVKNTDDIPDRSNDTKLGTLSNEEERLPTHEELSLWGESFEKLMKSQMGRKVFRDFLRSEYSEENLLFWLACEEMKNEEHADGVEEKARLIYEDYISILSPKEVSLDSRVREVINSNMAEPTPNTFDEAQLQIFTLMHRDSYPRFLNSQTYKKLVQQLS